MELGIGSQEGLQRSEPVLVKEIRSGPSDPGLGTFFWGVVAVTCNLSGRGRDSYQFRVVCECMTIVYLCVNSY